MGRECINSAKLSYCLQCSFLNELGRAKKLSWFSASIVSLHYTPFLPNFQEEFSQLTSIYHLFCVCDIVQIRFLPSFPLSFPLPLLSNGLQFRLTRPSLPSTKLSCLEIVQCHVSLSSSTLQCWIS